MESQKRPRSDDNDNDNDNDTSVSKKLTPLIYYVDLYSDVIIHDYLITGQSEKNL